MSGKKIEKFLYYGGFIIFIIPQLTWRVLPAVLTAFGASSETIDALSVFGGCLIIASIFYMFAIIIREQDPVWQKEHEIKVNDERNIRLREKASYAVGYVTLLTLTILAMLFLCFGNMPAVGLCLGVLLVQKSSLFIAKRVYAKKM